MTKIGMTLIYLCQEDKVGGSFADVAAITQNKDNAAFIGPTEAGILASIMGNHAAARNAKEKIRLRIKEILNRIPRSDLRTLIEHVLTSDYMRAWFYAEELGDHCFYLQTFDESDNCLLFTIDTETLCALNWGCEAVLNEAKKQFRLQDA